jgi:hypothetical protein
MVAIRHLPPPEWLIAGLVPQDGLVMLYGDPAAGKSFVALNWGLSIATCLPYLGYEVRQGSSSDRALGSREGIVGNPHRETITVLPNFSDLGLSTYPWRPHRSCLLTRSNVTVIGSAAPVDLVHFGLRRPRASFAVHI